MSPTIPNQGDNRRVVANRFDTSFGAADNQALGGLVISLDFELAWGVHDSIGSDGPYLNNLLGARDAVYRILDLFAEFNIHATWATVGFLFASSRDELELYSPAIRPSYLARVRDPYGIEIGQDEKSDPLHFAPSLIRSIASTPGQEIASHTFSHYYCLERGQSIDEFEADLSAAQAIARAHGHTMKTLILPRHQNRTDYLPVVAAAGFTAYRSNENNSLNSAVASNSKSLMVRGARLLDSYVSLSGLNLVPWATTAPDSYGLVDVRESRFLRPVNTHLAGLERLQFNRVAKAMREAARTKHLFHLWWHPHNFGINLEENLRQLRRLLQLREELHFEHGFGSYSIADVDHIARHCESPGTTSARTGSSGHASIDGVSTTDCGQIKTGT